MAQKHLVKAVGDYARSFSHESGKDYRVETQDLQPAMDRVQRIRHAQEIAKPGVMGRQYIGSVPVVVLTDWLKRHKYTLDQFARREGTIRQEFMRYFLSREFSKLHTQHSTSRIGTSNRIIVPGRVGEANDNTALRRAQDSGS